MDKVECGFPRLLVVDDNENIHEDIRYILVPVPGGESDDELLRLKADLFPHPLRLPPVLPDIRYRIDDAWQGEEAIRLVAEAVDAEDPYAVVFLDVKMPPGMDGIQTIGKLWEKDPRLEIVICTAYSDYDWEQILGLYGQTDQLLFIRKPFDSISIKQIALSLSAKWRLARANREHVGQLEAEVERRTQELERTVARLTTEVALRRDREFQVARLAHYDTLTGLMNRHSFYSKVGEIAASVPSVVEEPTHALLFADIDGFKLVNDSWGHDIGDLLLVEIAVRLREAVGNAPVLLDSSEACLEDCRTEPAVFRLGGDEFTVLLDYRGREDVRAVAELVLHAMGETFLIRGHEITIACSVGISLLRGDAPNFGALLKHADMAMYKAKEEGGTLFFYDQLRGTGWMDPIELAAEIGSLTDGSQMEVHYQPIAGEGNRTVGMAAMVRWRHARYGIVLPEDFIPIAEHMELLPELETRVLRIACRQAASLDALEHRAMFVLVRCTMNLFHMPDFPAIVQKILAESGLAPERLNLSLEERVLIRDREMSVRILNELAEIGVRITMESSGAGQSLNLLLHSLREGSTVLLDRALLANVNRHESDRLFLMNLLDTLRNRSLGILVGGVETAAQEAFMLKWNCMRQGFLYGSPVPFDNFVHDLMQGGT